VVTVSQRVPGDWRTLGTGPGQLTGFSVTPGWTITENLVFDGTYTTLTLSDTFRRQSTAVSMSFELIGTAVPAPGSAGVLALAAMGLMRRRR